VTRFSEGLDVYIARGFVAAYLQSFYWQEILAELDTGEAEKAGMLL
jgi:hypothetical protein